MLCGEAIKELMFKILEQYREGKISEEMVFDLEFEGWEGDQSEKNLVTKKTNIKVLK